MKIKHVSIRNNPILWNINLDFIKSDWDVCNTIIFVWENGSWKSTMLEMIYKFCNYDDPILWTNEEREFVVDLNHPDFWNWEYIFKYSKNIDTHSYSSWWLNNILIKKDWEEIHIHKFNNSQNSRDVLKWIFSDVSINFPTKWISSVTDLDTDLEIKQSIKSWSDTSQNVKQLLVDIDNRDNSDLAKRVDNNNQIVPEDMKHIRWKRFKNSFDPIFRDEWLEYVYCEWLNPSFKKWWTLIWIDNLSSWEKQIAYRWGFLLKDKNSLNESIILIDEPEISMHPVWQEKILDFHKNLFRNENWTLNSQIFLATHSPYVLWSMDYINDKIFTFPWWIESNNIKKYLWERPSLALLNYKIFNIATTDLFIELYWYIQESLNLWTLDSVDEKFKEWWYGKDYTWKRYNNKTGRPENENYTIFTYIRNYIHHPENPYENRNFTKQELKESIENMINLIETYNIELETNLDNQND